MFCTICFFFLSSLLLLLPAVLFTGHHCKSTASIWIYPLHPHPTPTTFTSFPQIINHHPSSLSSSLAVPDLCREFLMWRVTISDTDKKQSFPNVLLLLESCKMLGWSAEKLASSLHTVQTCTVNTELNRCYFQESLAPPNPPPPLFNRITHICFGLVTLEFFCGALRTRLESLYTRPALWLHGSSQILLLSCHRLNMFASRTRSQLNSLLSLKLCPTGSFMMPLCF